MSVAAVLDRDELDRRRFRGMNPAFVRKVWAKRRALKSDPEPVASKSDKQAQMIAEWQKRRLEKIRAQIEAGGVKAIIAEVALKHGFAVEDILGRSRVKGLIVARHEAIHEVAKARPSMSLPQLGRIFNRDHSTILSALNKFRDRANTERTDG